MQIHCIDETNGKLFLAAEFLSFLNDRKARVILYMPEKLLKLYGKFFQLFPKIEIRPANYPDVRGQSDVLVRFCEKIPQEIKEDEIFFPIIPESDKPGWDEKAIRFPNQIIPVDPAQNPAAYLTGESVSAGDLVLRSVSANDFCGKRILISAGPTAEDIDPVRYLTNRSTGKMGLALARTSFIRGADVQLVMGPSGLTVPAYLNTIRVRSAKEMAKAIFGCFSETDVYIGTAAVADYTSKFLAENKIKKGGDGLQLFLQRTTDILQELQHRRRHQIMIGFSVETDQEFENSKRKLKKKNLDLIVINNPKQAGAAFAGDTNLVSIYSRTGHYKQYPLLSKMKVSNIILDWVIDVMQIK